VEKSDRVVTMQKVRRFRAMSSLCRQQAAYNPVQRCELISEAEHWEHLAEAELAALFHECNLYCSTDLAKEREAANSNDTGYETISAA
jgi:hypothetical protein